MISPLVRRRRLAGELVRLRHDHGCSAQYLAEAIGVARQRISRLENARVPPDLDEIMRILTVLPVDPQRWNQIMDIARDAQQRGWWHTHADAMGPRQALYADLEAGAAHIAEYHMALLPGLLQTPAYSQARIHADTTAHTHGFDPDQALHARITRQRMLHRPQGPHYEAIIDEIAIRRPAAAPYVMRSQLDHLADLGHHQPCVTLRILPLGAAIAGHTVPRCSFSRYRYPDPDDPSIVAVDTITTDLILTRPDQTTPYHTLYQRLHTAALNPSDSLDLIITQAEALTTTLGS